MDFLTFLREASEYSAGITIAAWVFIGLQLELRMRTHWDKFEKLVGDTEEKCIGEISAANKKQDEKHAKADKLRGEILRDIDGNLASINLSLTEKIGDMGQRISALEGKSG